MLATFVFLSALSFLVGATQVPMSSPCITGHLTCCASIEPAWFARKEFEHVGAPFIHDFSTPVGIGCYPLNTMEVFGDNPW